MLAWFRWIAIGVLLILLVTFGWIVMHPKHPSVSQTQQTQEN